MSVPAPSAPATPAERPASPVHYETVATWEEYVSGAYQTTTCSRPLTVQAWPTAGAHVVDWRLGPVSIRKRGEVSALEAVARQLGSLYEHLVLRLSPAGAVVALDNHAAVLRRWEQVQAELQPTDPAADPVTSTLLDFCARQVTAPAKLLASLDFDYLFAAVLQRVAGPAALGSSRLRVFPRFFAHQDVWFTETTAPLAPAEAAGPTGLLLQGTLHEGRTEVAAIRAAIAGQLPPAKRDFPAAALRFYYQAQCHPDPATGLPAHLELRVGAQVADYHNKEYTLRVTSL